MGFEVAQNAVSGSIYGISHLIDEGFDAAGGGFGGVFGTEAAGGCVARIGKELKAVGAALFVHFYKNVFADDGLAAKFGFGNAVFGKLRPQRHRAQGANVGGDVVANGAITTGGGPHELVVFIN